ncbi:MAG: hypothetical protein GY731_16315 [Gammaproteobacteria bacterium]|nr:hypothetical protein [Gammaproteobacteria bacterium]
MLKTLITALLGGLLLISPAQAGVTEMVGDIVNRILRGDYDVVEPLQIPAPIRTIPDSADYGTMMPPVGRQIRIDGEPMMLSPGAQIRDVRNRIIQPMVLTRPVPVRYTLDLTQHVHRVWVLTPGENIRD